MKCKPGKHFGVIKNRLTSAFLVKIDLAGMVGRSTFVLSVVLIEAIVRIAGNRRKR